LKKKGFFAYKNLLFLINKLFFFNFFNLQKTANCLWPRSFTSCTDHNHNKL